MNQVKKNFIYNFLYQILTLLLPLITVPYISRVLGTNGVGIYSYTYSITYYFIIFGLLGINNYGNRSIAKVRDDKNKLSKTFFSIYYLQLILCFISILLYVGYILIFDSKFLIIAYIQMIYLVSNIFDINWFFFGLEKFKLTVIRNTIIKVLSLIAIFLFVKNSNDVWIYTLILASSSLLSNLLLLPFLKKEVVFEKVSLSDIKQHLKPVLILFIPVIAVSLYKVMDKIMLGMFISVDEVGFYEQAEKLINIPMGVITALGTVMLPRISNLISKGDFKKMEEYILKSVEFMMFMSFPLCFGLIAISNDFIPIFLGDGFNKSIVLLSMLSVTIIFVSFANVIRTQYLLPKEKDKIYIVSVIIGAVLNLIFNLIFIPLFSSVGACIGTIISEFFVMAYQTYMVRHELPISNYFKIILPFFLKSIIMFEIVLFVKCLNILVIYKLIIEIFAGLFVYGILNIDYIFRLISFRKKVR